MKKMISVLGLIALIFGVSGDFVSAKGKKSKKYASLTGHLYGILVVPAEEMAKLPDQAKKLRFAKETVSDLNDGRREVKMGIQGWTVKIGRDETITDETGAFEFLNIRVRKKMYLSVSFDGETILKQRIWLESGRENVQDMVLMQDVNKMMNMGVREHGDDVHRFKSHVQCNKYNFACFSPVYSDCYKNLIRGNPYCWAELLNLPWPPRWCDGDKNCSRFIGHPQGWHCDFSQHFKE